MSIDIINYRGYQIRRGVNLVILGLNVLLFVAMVKGPVGSFSIYINYDFPIWAYVLTVLFMVISFVLYMNNVQNKVPIIGVIEFSEKEVILDLKNRKSKIKISDIEDIHISPDYARDKIYDKKSIYTIKFSTSNFSYVFDLMIEEEFEIAFRDFVNDIMADTSKLKPHPRV